MSDVLLIDDRDGVRTLTLNRPHRKNAIDVELWHALAAALRAADTDDVLRELGYTAEELAGLRGEGAIGPVRA